MALRYLLTKNKRTCLFAGNEAYPGMRLEDRFHNPSCKDDGRLPRAPARRGRGLEASPAGWQHTPLAFGHLTGNGASNHVSQHGQNQATNGSMMLRDTYFEKRGKGLMVQHRTFRQPGVSNGPDIDVHPNVRR